MWNFNQMVGWFSEPEANKLLNQADWGIERETQRVTETGDLALTDHPEAFGNKLSNPCVTTDFAESQLELITQPLHSIEAMFKELGNIHDKVEDVIDEEYLWPMSMPPRLPSEELIPIAKYDQTPEGRASEQYRESLAERYGKKMQMISGLHVNFSFQAEFMQYLAAKLGREQLQEVQNDVYFALARNFLRYRWLLIYLYGASPLADESYDSVVYNELDEVEECFPHCSPKANDYEKYATSLRVSRYGYSNAGKREISVSFDSLADHISSFKELLKSSINSEREFYSSIRLKPHMLKGVGYLDALESKGVRYAEVRLVDLNPYDREGVSLRQLRSLHVFLLWCLFEESPPINDEECTLINENHHKVSLYGRQPGLQLTHYEQGQVDMTTWMEDIFRKLREVALMLDRAQNGTYYSEAIAAEYEKVHNIDKTLAAQIINDMNEHEESFIAHGMRLAKAHKRSKQVRSACC